MQIMWGLFIFELQYVISAVYGNKTEVVIDLNKCKLTHLGTEYTGKVARSETNATCQYWSRSNRKVSGSSKIKMHMRNAKVCHL